MESLSAARLRKVLRAVASAAEFRDLAEFRVGSVALVRDLVPCESASFNEVKPGLGAVVVADPEEWVTRESIATFGRLSGENPLVSHYTRTGEGHPRRFSDFVSRRELHKLTLYDWLYRPMGIEHQLAFVLPSPPDEVVGIALNRMRHDFTNEEVAVLELLRRPLRACYQRLVERESRSDRLAAYEEGVDMVARAVSLGLTEREVEVMVGVSGGASNAEVAMSLGISRRTVEKHLQNIYARLGVTSRTQAIGSVRGLN